MVCDLVEGDTRLHKPAVAGSSPAAATFSRTLADGTIICESGEQDYFGWKGLVNCSQLKQLDESPLAFRDLYVTGSATRPTSDAFDFGKKLHSRMQLGESEFYSRCEDATGKEVTATGAISAVGRARMAELEAEGKYLLTPQDHEKLNGILGNALEIPLIQQALDDRVAAEFNIRFKLNGHWAKSRIDHATPDGFWDWKTTREPNPYQWARSAIRFRYHMQAAFYARAGVAAGWPWHAMKFVVMSTVWPFEVAVVELPDNAMRRGDELVVKLIEELAVRKEWDFWHRYEVLDTHVARVPDYLLREV